MPLTAIVDVDNATGFADPRLHVGYAGWPQTEDLVPIGKDGFGPVFEVGPPARPLGSRCVTGRERTDCGRASITPSTPLGLAAGERAEVWTLTRSAFTYRVEPAVSADGSAEAFLARLRDGGALLAGTYVPDSGGLSGLGAIPLTTAGCWWAPTTPPPRRRISPGTSTSPPRTVCSGMSSKYCAPRSFSM
jgi:hypothetical protein